MQSNSIENVSILVYSALKYISTGKENVIKNIVEMVIITMLIQSCDTRIWISEWYFKSLNFVKGSIRKQKRKNGDMSML